MPEYNSNDPLPPKPPEFLQHLRWFRLHGRKYWLWIGVAVLLLGAFAITRQLASNFVGTPEGVSDANLDSSAVDLEIRILEILAEPSDSGVYSDAVLALRLNADPNDLLVATEALARRGLIIRALRSPQDDHIHIINDKGRRYLVGTRRDDGSGGSTRQRAQDQ